MEDMAHRPVRLATRRLREEQLRAFASALVQRGRDPATICGLADLVSLDAVKDGLRFFVDRRGGASTRTIHDLACTLKTVAKHWVRTDKATLDALAAIGRRLSLPAEA
jgi:hypothetical protein